MRAVACNHCPYLYVDLSSQSLPICGFCAVPPRLSPRPGGPISILFRHWCPDPVSEEFWMSLWKNLDAYARGRRQILSGCGPVLACHHSPCCTWGGVGGGLLIHYPLMLQQKKKQGGGESTKFWGGHVDGLSRTAQVAMGRRATHRWS